MKEARATIKSGYGVVAHCHKVRTFPPSSFLTVDVGFKWN
jgi:hypothetical protein